ncbi:L-lactate dehydrogenase [Marinobacter nauticus]|uniref:Alpha-hydroxy-acid oxidizing enzyme n=1 Tax=Marinobacter nauticus TaxID=2743 RepID=A0A1M2V0Q0_MARNT|nr:L-lactate dehydrogenase [Marinobacter nauticus]OJT01161.1 alpha-hydroxy-acid oxidizing enzyme [Marinobacter nauticus]
MPLSYPATAADYQILARRKLPRFLADYLDGGATEEQTLRANVSGWQDIALRQRVLMDVDNVDTHAQLAGQSCSMPVALAPLGLAGMMAQRGEAQAVKAANAADVPFTLSTVGICPLEEVKAAASAPFWFQLYMIRDREYVDTLLKKAWNAGCQTLIFTIDLPLPGPRHRDTRNGLDSSGARSVALKAQQLLSRPGWLWQVAIKGKPLTFGNLSDAVPEASNLDSFKQWVDTQFDASVTWQAIEWLRERWPGKLILKGILEVDDAKAAVNVGADGIVVSNHGGRQLDGVAATASKLPDIVAAVGKDTEILVDGGIRNGVDVFRALALGANGVMVGRPWAWALAAEGQAGLTRLLNTWQQELKLAMTLTGVTRIADISAAHLDLPNTHTLTQAGEQQ